MFFILFKTSFFHLGKKDFENYRSVWVMSSDFVNNTMEWMTGDFGALDGDQVEARVNEWWTQSYRLIKVNTIWCTL